MSHPFISDQTEKVFRGLTPPCLRGGAAKKPNVEGPRVETCFQSHQNDCLKFSCIIYLRVGLFTRGKVKSNGVWGGWAFRMNQKLFRASYNLIEKLKMDSSIHFSDSIRFKSANFDSGFVTRAH